MNAQTSGDDLTGDQRSESAADTHRVLTKARGLVAEPGRWWDGNSKKAKNQVCIYGALYRANARFPHAGAEAVFRKLLGVVHLNEWNDADGRTHAEVLAAFDAAIASLGAPVVTSPSSTEGMVK